MYKKESVKISIIIPVYNVREWMDECLQSIEQQSFHDFEVILIDDGSTDGSGQKCDQWSQKDSRFRVIHKENAGPSIARNIGIKVAKGEYLSFVDSDDWIEKEFLDKLYQAIVEDDADMAECDVYRVDSRTGIKTIRTCSGNLGKDFTLEEHMKYGYTAIWKCLIRRELFEKYDIEFPNCHSEAKAIYPLVIALSKKIVNVKESLYNYRQFRKDSLSFKPRKNDGDETAIGLRAFDALIQGFKDNGIANKYEKNLQQIIVYKLSDMLAASFHRKTKEEYEQLVNKYRDYIANNFPLAKDVTYITLGGYNLNRILWNMNMLHDASCRFNFSSIISIMNEVKESIELTHKNKYREIMIQRDIKSEFWDVLKEKKPEFIFIDFLEERFDILQCGQGYITESDAYEGGLISGVDARRIERDSLECEKLWKQSCKDFIVKIQQEYDKCKIVLVKNYLCEKIGDINNFHYYDNLEYIRDCNQRLKRYYQYFEQNCSNIISIDVAEDELYFTDEKYEYGAIPSHLNEIVNRNIAKRIEKLLDI